MALPKINRLTSRQDFQAVFREGMRRNGSHLTLRALRSKLPQIENQGTASTSSKDVLSQDVEKETMVAASKLDVNPTRIGISISTKVSKRAVVRNRIKRQLRSAFKSLLPRLSPGWRLVVIVKPLAAQEECDYQQFLQELEQLLASAEVLNGYS